MADNGENIGGINVSVGADYSQLLSDFQSMQSAASTAGGVVADSFNGAAQSVTTFDDAVAKAVADGATLAEAIQQASAQFNPLADSIDSVSGSLTDLVGAEKTATEQMSLFGDAIDSVPWSDANGQLNLFTDELEPLSAGLTQTSGAAKETASGVTGVGSAAAETQAPIQQAGLSLSDFVKGMIALQASLTALSGLRDFASSAIDASDSFKQAQISLANLTGSAAQASQTIGQLIDLAQQDGLSMPAVLTAATRMQALVGAAAPVPEILSQLANAGSVSGQGIEAAANAFDRIVTSGTAAARTLLPLGINLEDLAKSFNSLTNTSEATNQNVGTLLKTLSETDRVTVLTDALNKLNGTAQEVANETFGGQWNQLIAQWSQVLKAAGDAMAPLLADLVQLAKTDLVPFAQAAAGAFKTFTETISTVKNTIDGLVTSLGNIATSIPGVKTAWDTFTEAVGKYNTYSLAKDAINELALGVQTLFNITPGATTMNDAMTASLNRLQSSGTTAAKSIDLIGDAVKTLLDTDKTTAAQFDTDQKALNQITQSLVSGQPAYKDHVASLQDQWAALEKVNSVAANLPQALSSVSLALANDTMAAQKATLQYQAQAGAYQETLQAFNAGNATLGQVDAAFQKMTQAEQAAANAGAPVAGSLQDIDEKASAAVNSTKILATTFGLAADQAKAQSDAIDDLNANVLVDSQRLDLLVNKEQQVAQQVQAGTAQYSQQLQIKQQIAAANQKLINDTQALQTAELAAGNAAAEAGGEIGLLTQAQNEANLAVDQAKQKFDDGLTSVNAYISAQKAAVTAAENLAAAAAEQRANVNASTDSLSAAASVAAGAAAKLQVVTQAFKDQKASIDEVVSAQNAYISSELKLAEQQAIANSGLQGVTDAIGLQDTALVKAQADVDTYTRLQQQGYDVASQLQSALNTLASAQDKYNGMVQSGNPLMVTQDAALKAVYSDQQTLAPAIDNTTTAIGRQVSALQQQANALNGVAAAVNQVESDITAALGIIPDTAGGTVNVQQGYHLGGGLLTGVGEFGGQSTSYGLYGDQSTVAAQAKAQETALYDQGYTPQAISKAMAVPLSQVLTDLGLTAAQANSTKAGSGANGQIVIGGPIDLSGVPGFPATSSSSSSSGSTAPVFGSSGGGTSAVDGGSYPAVTAHQAVGEVWAVSGTVGGATGGGGGSSVITTSISNTVTGGSDSSLQAATSAIGTVAQQIATNSEGLLPISQSLIAATQALQQVATAIGSGAHLVNTGSNNPSTTYTATGSSGTAYTSGGVIQNTPSQGPGILLPAPPSTPISNVPGYNPFGPGSSSGPPGSTTINVTVNAQGSIGMNSQQLNAQITSTVASTLVAQLQTAGARLTR